MKRPVYAAKMKRPVYAFGAFVWLPRLAMSVCITAENHRLCIKTLNRENRRQVAAAFATIQTCTALEWFNPRATGSSRESWAGDAAGRMYRSSTCSTPSPNLTPYVPSPLHVSIVPW